MRNLFKNKRIFESALDFKKIMFKCYLFNFYNIFFLTIKKKQKTKKQPLWNLQLFWNVLNTFFKSNCIKKKPRKTFSTVFYHNNQQQLNRECANKTVYWINIFNKHVLTCLITVCNKVCKKRIRCTHVSKCAEVRIELPTPAGKDYLLHYTTVH